MVEDRPLEMFGGFEPLTCRRMHIMITQGVGCPPDRSTRLGIKYRGPAGAPSPVAARPGLSGFAAEAEVPGAVSEAARALPNFDFDSTSNAAGMLAAEASASTR